MVQPHYPTSIVLLHHTGIATSLYSASAPSRPTANIVHVHHFKTIYYGATTLLYLYRALAPYEDCD